MTNSQDSRSSVGHISTVLLIALTGCAADKVEQIDYGSTQQPASIIVSDPQVYSRASLINDRRSEIDYLQQLLSNSTVGPDGKSKVVFSPEIVQDLRTIEAFSASLGVSAGKSSASNTTAAALTQQIQNTTLAAQLAVLQKQVQGIQNAQPPNISIPAPPLDSGTLSSAPPASTQSVPDTTAIAAALKNIQDRLDASKAAGPPTAPIDSYAGLSDPRNDFTDRQAYRRDIRAALSEAQLDDVHDRGGNALYRLQFQATVLPLSSTSRQWGAAKITIEPPLLRAADISSAYYEWLSYLSSQLNTSVQGKDASQATSPGQVHSYDLDRYLGEVGRANYFNVIDLFQSNFPPGGFYCLDHRTAEAPQLVEMDNKSGKAATLLFRFDKIGTYAVPPSLVRSEQCDSYPTATSPYTLSKAIDAGTANSVVGWIRQYRPQHTAIRTEGYSLALPAGTNVAGTTSLDPMQFVPPSFCEAIVQSNERTHCSNLRLMDTEKTPIHAAGNYVAPSDPETSRVDTDYAVRSYSVLPTELAQRVGITTEASQSLETALSISAQVSAAVNANLGAGFLRQADARAQAIARQPIVVGFAGTESEKASTPRVGRGYFGWLFGPEFSVKDSKTLALDQGVHTYGVNADVAFPGWWGYVDLSISTAWVDNWQLPGVLPEETPPKGAVSVAHKRVNLPVSDATYESLTNFIAAQQYGPSNSHIFVSYITPTVVPSCATSVTFQIGGTNIWRADHVYLGGAKAKSVTVLPDMNGIAAQFDMDDVYGALVSTDTTVQPLQLMVSAEQGSAAPSFIWVVGKRQTANGSTSCQSPLLLPANLETLSPTVITYFPAEICANATAVPLALQGINLAPFDVLSDALELRAATNTWQGDSFHEAAYLSIKKGVKLTVGNLPIALTAANGSVGLNLVVKNCATAAKDADSTDTPPGSSSKATLQSTTVQLAKDQKVALKAALPSSYSEIAVWLRPKTTPNNLSWNKSTSAIVATGAAGSVTGSFDLSGMNWPVGSSLDVRISVQSNPNVESTFIASDKSLVVAKASATNTAQPATPVSSAPAKKTKASK